MNVETDYENVSIDSAPIKAYQGSDSERNYKFSNKSRKLSEPQYIETP